MRQASRLVTEFVVPVTTDGRLEELPYTEVQLAEVGSDRQASSEAREVRDLATDEGRVAESLYSAVQSPEVGSVMQPASKLTNQQTNRPWCKPT